VPRAKRAAVARYVGRVRASHERIEAAEVLVVGEPPQVLGLEASKRSVRIWPLWKRSAVAGVIPGQAGELRGIGGLDADGQHEIVPASTAEASHGCGVPRLRRLHQTSLTCRGLDTLSRRLSVERREQLDALVAGVVDPRRHRIDLKAPVRERPDELERPVGRRPVTARRPRLSVA
jgi:hypothetical protein